jgi:hypothetical protein
MMQFSFHNGLVEPREDGIYFPRWVFTSQSMERQAKSPIRNFIGCSWTLYLPWEHAAGSRNDWQPRMAASTGWRHASQRASQGGILPPTDTVFLCTQFYLRTKQRWSETIMQPFRQ